MRYTAWMRRMGAGLVLAPTLAGCGSIGPDAEPLGSSRHALGADDDHTVLILSTTVVPDPNDAAGRSSEQLLAEAAGLTVEIADPATWAAKTTADFATYRAIILGDPSISFGCAQDPSPVAPAEANRGVWGPAVKGNVILAGASPVFHEIDRRDDASLLIQGAVQFAAAEPSKTGAYISLSCYYSFGAFETAVPVLEPFNSASTTFTVSSACFDDVHKVAEHSTLASVVDPVLSNWICSANEAFHSFPSPEFAPFAIGLTSSDPDALTFADGTSGVPYIVAHGITPTGCGNGHLDPREECDDGNASSCDGCSLQCTFECGNGVTGCGEQCDDGNRVGGDGCSATCQREVCGNGVLDVGEQCDDDNTVGGDGCSATCRLEVCGNGILDVGEQCDDGNTVGGDGCSATCRVEVCGNGVLDVGEQCDDGNTVNGDGCSSTCTIEDRPPVALCKNVTATADASCHANASVDNGSFDPDGDPFTCSPNPAGPYTRGTTNVTLTCTDSKNASSSCVGAVTVVDTTRPVFTFVPSAITISVCVNANIGQATATDNCGTVAVTKNAPTKFPLGKTVVTWTATDASGNTRTATQNVTAILSDSSSCCPSGTNVILGTSGSDNIVGTDGSDCILGRGGDDVIDARGGDDFVSGGAGRDNIYGGLGDDIIYGGDGDDNLDGSLGTNKCSGGTGINTISNCTVISP